MTRRRVRFTTTARQHVRLFDDWWRANATRPEILHSDLDEAITLLSSFPAIGSPYRDAPIPGVRRLYLERLMSHLYYTFDDRELIVRALWHARRGSGPDFGTSG